MPARGDGDLHDRLDRGRAVATRLHATRKTIGADEQTRVLLRAKRNRRQRDRHEDRTPRHRDLTDWRRWERHRSRRVAEAWRATPASVPRAPAADRRNKPRAHASPR